MEPLPGATTDAAAGVFGRERRALTVGILLAIASFAVEGMGVVPALPLAVRSLDGMRLFGWAFSAFMLAWLVGTVAGGQLADRRGPRLPMALGLCGFAAGLLLASASRAMAQLLAGRALQGVGGGAMIAAAYVAIARGYPDQLRARMMALTASVWIIPAVVGPALSGAIAERASWRLVFAGMVPLIGLTALLVLPPLRPLDVDRARSGVVRLPSALRLALGATLLLAAPSLRGLGWAVVVACVGAGAVLFLPALRSLLPTGTLVGRRGLPIGLVARSLLAFSFFGSEAFIPLGAIDLRAASASRAGVALTAGAIGWIAASWIQDHREARDGAGGRVLRVGVGFLLLATGIATVGVVLVTQLPLWLGAAGWAVGGAGIGLAYGAGSLLCFASVAAGEEGEVSGQLQLAEALGTAAGTGLLGALLTVLAQLGRTPRQCHATAFALTTGFALLGAALSGRLAPDAPQRQ